MPLYFLAILEPKPDKTARVCLFPKCLPTKLWQLCSAKKKKTLRQVQEICRSVSDYVKENEPGVLKYQWFRSGPPEKPKIYVWEMYIKTNPPEILYNHCQATFLRLTATAVTRTKKR